MIRKFILDEIAIQISGGRDLLQPPIFACQASILIFEASILAALNFSQKPFTKQAKGATRGVYGVGMGRTLRSACRQDVRVYCRRSIVAAVSKTYSSSHKHPCPGAGMVQR